MFRALDLKFHELQMKRILNLERVDEVSPQIYISALVTEMEKVIPDRIIGV